MSEKNNTIELRENIDNTIFDELKEKYEKCRISKRVYEDILNFYTIRTSLDIRKLKLISRRNNIRFGDVNSIFHLLHLQMAKEHGFYCVYDEILVEEIGLDHSLSVEEVEIIISALINNKFLFKVEYNGEQRLLSPYSVYSYEIVKDNNLKNRIKKQKAKEKKDKENNNEINTASNYSTSPNFDISNFNNSSNSPYEMPSEEDIEKFTQDIEILSSNDFDSDEEIELF